MINIHETWNLICNATECLLIPAVPLVNALRMEDTLRNAWLPSNPATDPETEDVPGTRLFPNNSLIHLLKHGKM